MDHNLNSVQTSHRKDDLKQPTKYYQSCLIILFRTNMEFSSLHYQYVKVYYFQNHTMIDFTVMLLTKYPFYFGMILFN
jgi:hypothetical protein